MWFGWFLFNAVRNLDASKTSLASIAINTVLSGASGGAAVLFMTLKKFGKTDPSMTMNGVLAGPIFD
ncbi:ammonium transporter [Domibacillus tundrae]|uniref:ammonium transporter n=1 Tax=Domibacillus tundrae TaxID=1587527 RepID=UPI000617B950